MLINYSWIIRRRRILFSAFVDFFLIICFYNIFHLDNFQSYPNKFVTFCIAAFWIIISYIIGRYMQIKNINSNGLIKNLIKIVFLFLLCNFVYLIINYGLIIVFDIFLVKVPYQNFDRLLFYSFFESLISQQAKRVRKRERHHSLVLIKSSAIIHNFICDSSDNLSLISLNLSSILVL